MVHLLRRGEDLLLAARRGIAAGDDHAVVVEVIVLDAEALCVFGAQARHDRHDVAQDVLAEGLHLLLVVAEAAHAVVAQLDEVDVAHLFGDTVAHLHEQVEDLVQLRLVRLQPAAEHLVALFARGAVGVLGVLHQRGAGHRLAAEAKFHAAHQVGIAAHELVFLHHVLDHGLGHGLALHLHGPEQHRGERLLELCAEGGIEQCGGIGDRIVVDLRADLVVVFIFGHIKLVHGVDGVAHAGEAGVGRKLQQLLQIVLAGVQDLVHALRVPDAGQHILHHGGDLFDRYAAVGQLGYFHDSRPFFGCGCAGAFLTLTIHYNLNFFNPYMQSEEDVLY